jgi:hypothetical protein
MTWDSASYGYGDADDDAPDVEGNAGACPPLILRYRIYPEKDFSAVFDDPPENVLT